MGDLIAVTRDVSPSITECQLTHVGRVAIDPEKASAQHADYERALERLGCSVRRLPAGADMPDSVFIEDTAVVLDEIAVITWPGAESRRSEILAVAAVLGTYRTLTRIEPPGTLDGGDVMLAGRTIFIGASGRSNHAGIEQMTRMVAPFGYRVHPVVVRRCLHLKSAVTALSDETLLINRSWIDPDAVRGFGLLDVDPAEPSAANIVRVRSRLLYSEGFPRTRERLERRGFDVITVDVSELAKAEGAVTCCSLIFKERSCPSVV
jgi:dimethylargininase